MQAALQSLDQQSRINHHQKREETRDELLVMATERFCDAQSHNRLSSDQYKEAFYLLINAVSAETKSFVAEQLALCPFTPRPLALFFALEELPIAEPVLKTSQVLGQLDLLQIIENKGHDHAALIAQRKNIGPSVIERLRRIGSTSIDGFLSGSAEAPATKIEHERKPVAREQELRREPSAQTKNEVSAKSPVAKQQNTKAESALLDAANRSLKPKRLSAHQTTATMAPTTFGTVMERVAKSGNKQGLVTLMQRRFNLSASTAFKVLEDKSGDTLAVLLKAGGIAPAQANRIEMLTFPEIGLSTQNAKRALMLFARLKTDSCLKAVEQWPKIESNKPEHAPVLAEGRDQIRVDSENAALRKVQQSAVRHQLAV